MPLGPSGLSAPGEQLVRLGHELARRLSDVPGRPGPAELGAGRRVRSEGVLLLGAQKEPSRSRAATCSTSSPLQRAPRTQAKVVRISDGGSGLSARTVARRLSSISGLFAYLIVRGDAGVTTSPVPRGLITRRARRNSGRAAPLVRTPEAPAEDPAAAGGRRLDGGAAHQARDRAMVEAMVLGGLRRCEVLGPAHGRPAGR